MLRRLPRIREVVRQTSIREDLKQGAGKSKFERNKCVNFTLTKFKTIDQFAESYVMRLDDGHQSIPSLMGSFLSFLLLIVICAYVYQKFDVLLARKDVDVLSSLNDSVFTDDDVFDFNNGFAISAAFTAYDSETEYILDKSYGELVFN